MEPQELIEFEQARAAVLRRSAPVGAEPVALDAALGRTLAETAGSEDPIPGFDNSAMDGFAVRASDTSGALEGTPVSLRLVGESRAGRPAEVGVGPGETVAISTGAMMPGGADAVVRVEQTGSSGVRVSVRAEVEAGRDIRRAGEDIAAGATVLEAGAHLGPAQLGVLASIGCATVACHRRPRVSILTSGDELLGPDQPMRPGGVRDSNSHSVSALAKLAGAEVVSVGSMPDRVEATRAAIEPALSADVAVICGGVSVGEHDHVKGVLQDLGVERHFWRIALKPGKPTWFGSRGPTLVFGLPGNPVSAMVTFILLVRPALIAISGGQPERHRTVARLDRDQRREPGRANAIRCRLDLDQQGWLARPTGPQGSHILTSMLDADCLALLPPGRDPLPAGEQVEVELIGHG